MMDGPEIPKVAGVPPGADFVRVIFDRLSAENLGRPPEDLARTTVLVPTRRMQRRLKQLYLEEGSHLLPSIGLVSDIGSLLAKPIEARPVSWLQRLMDVKALVAKLVELDERIPESAVIDLSHSLIKLLDEMHGEGVSFDAFEAIAPNFVSDHWTQSLGFLRAIRAYLDALPSEVMDGEALHRRETEQLCSEWRESPPSRRIILAGSTGSRASTRLLMQAVAELPNGSVVLPGFDFDLPPQVWDRLSETRELEDHAQYRFAAFLRQVGLRPSDVVAWSGVCDKQRNKLISLSLRPAPVTDQWLVEGPKIGDLQEATTQISLVEAPSSYDEANAIAVAIRAALLERKRVALIAPDATLARRVTAALSPWKIVPDDSGGVPMSLSANGRFVRHVLNVLVASHDTVGLVALLKHPLTRAGEPRGEHMLATQEFEVFLRKNGVRNIDRQTIQQFAVVSENRKDWADWLADCLTMIGVSGALNLPAQTSRLIRLAKAFSGTHGWSKAIEGDSGAKLSAIISLFEDPALEGPEVSVLEYRQLFETALLSESLRPTVVSRPDVMIWGTLEARVQGADVVILSGLNEGTWPKTTSHDPWLNRAMRREVGLLLPERQIGLAAHDFQQAISAERVVLTRSKRTDGTETVPSRWLSRLTNLLEGLPDNGGPPALGEMKKRGDALLSVNAGHNTKGETKGRAARPAPAPPIDFRPRSFSVTEIERLIRDPYAIYARRILGLSKLDPLVPEDDARRKGIVFHKIMEDFLSGDHALGDPEKSKRWLLEVTKRVLSGADIDPVLTAGWSAHIDRIADWIIDTEINRMHSSRLVATEATGQFEVPGTSFVLRGKADRIDVQSSGDYEIIDYKTGGLPKKGDIESFDQQLVLEALMLQAGSIADVPPGQVAELVHQSLSRKPDIRSTNVEQNVDLVTKQAELVQILDSFLNPNHGYMARRAREGQRFGGDYDHLSRFGEWDESTEPVTQVLS